MGLPPSSVGATQEIVTWPAVSAAAAAVSCVTAAGVRMAVSIRLTVFSVA